MNKNITEFALDYPITTKDGREMDHLQLHRLNVGQLQASQNITDNTKRSMQMLADSAHISVDDIALLDVADYDAASEVVVSFLKRKKPSQKPS